MKRYVAEPGSEAVREAMQASEGWFICRIGLLEAARAVATVAGPRALERVKREWPAFAVIDVDHQLVEDALSLALKCDLRSLDSLHLASAVALEDKDLLFVTWDRRLHAAAGTVGIDRLPSTLG